jgi:large subunit ribosomal protein L30
MAKSFLVTLKKGLRGCSKTQRQTIECLGLRKINSQVTVADNSANRGQIIKIQHLVEVVVQK